jgi:hypothetical protein
MGLMVFSPGLGADDLFLPGPQPRRLRPDEFRARLRERGLDVVAGVERFTDVTDARSYSAHLPICSPLQVFEAHLLHQGHARHLEWETEPVPDPCAGNVMLVFALAMGNGAPFPQPSGRFDLSVDGDPLMSFGLTKRSRHWAGTDSRLYYDVQQVRTATFGELFTLDEHIRDENTFVDGLVFLRLPRRLCRPGRRVRLCIDAINRHPSTNWVRIGRTNAPSLGEVVAPGLERALAGPERPRHGGRLALFGDLHNHSGQSALIDAQPPGVGAGSACGVGDRESLFRHARDIAGLDFFCLSEHDWQMSEQDWEHLGGLTEAFNSSGGTFTTLHGFEWTSSSYGHRNVYFRNEPGPMVYAADPKLPQNTIGDGLPTPTDLWNRLRDCDAPAMTVPHHMSVKQFPLSLENFYDIDFDRVAEIYSCWGDSLEHDRPVSALASRVAELAFIQSVRAGYQVGFVASSDSHDGHPGSAQGTDTRKHLFHYLGSGQTGVLVDDPQRESIFDAIAARRCFAVTGERIVACAELDGQPMGSVLEARRLSRQPTLRVAVTSFLPVERIVIYRNGEPVDRITADSATDIDLDWPDTEYQRGHKTNYFAKVVRADGEQAWTSPTWVSD